LHIEYEQPEFSLPDSHVTIDSLHQTQDPANVLWLWRH